jgi:hypothetical protein
MIQWLRNNATLIALDECSPGELSRNTKVLVNGNWIGVIQDVLPVLKQIYLYRRNGIIPVHTSVYFDRADNIIYIYTDSGRLTRPVFYIDSVLTEDNNDISYTQISYARPKILERIETDKYSWTDAVAGFMPKSEEFQYTPRNSILFENPLQLYPSIPPDKLNRVLESQRSIIDYIDTSEEEGAYIATTMEQLATGKHYTHCEIDPSYFRGYGKFSGISRI